MFAIVGAGPRVVSEVPGFHRELMERSAPLVVLAALVSGCAEELVGTGSEPLVDVSDIVWCLEYYIEPAYHEPDSVFDGIDKPEGVHRFPLNPPWGWNRADIWKNLALEPELEG